MHTKIIATIGLETEKEKNLLALIKAGVRMIRVNFSHASYDQYLRVQKIIKAYNRKNKNNPVSLMMDLQGPRIRVGQMPEKGIVMRLNEEYQFTYSRRAYQNDQVIPIDNQDLYKYIKPKDPLFLCNGDIELTVTAVEDKVIKAKVINNGVLHSNKGVNVPNTNLKKFGLTAKDRRDVAFGIQAGMDYVALSFVQTAEDVKRLKKLLGKDSTVKIISKIERGIALKNINEIIKESDVIMIARGDLGIEVPIEELPIIQKNLIKQAHWYGKPAILATQIMTSMIKNPHPTRAEVSDIANAIFDRADMVMLSDETAVGDYPIEAVKIMRKIVKKTTDYVNKNCISE
ncbi:MAG: pyruvate kinase [Patescibacteria group bacterium]|jgi:pyruvate kinase